MSVVDLLGQRIAHLEVANAKLLIASAQAEAVHMERIKELEEELEGYRNGDSTAATEPTSGSELEK